MPFSTTKSSKYEQEARKLVEDELAASGQRKHTLLRRKSKLGPSDRGAITAAFNKYAASNPSLPEDMVTALVTLLKSTTPNTDDLTKDMNDLLIANARCSSSPCLIAALASEAQPDVVGSVLSDAIRASDIMLINQLLSVGADPKYLHDIEIIELVKLDSWMFQRMQARFPLADGRLHALCIFAIDHGDIYGLAALMNGRMDATSQAGSGITALHRDALLSVALKPGQRNMIAILDKIALRTSHWPLQDAGILQTALDCTQGDSSLQFSIFEFLFTRFQMPEKFNNPSDLESVFHRCLQHGRYDVISLMTGSNLKVPASVVAYVCENDLLQVLDELLKGDVEIPDNLWLHTPSLLRHGSTAIVERFLSYMYQHYIDVPQKELLLLQCISAGHTHLIDRLIGLGVDVNGNGGEVLRAAIQSGDISLVKTIMTSPISVEALEYGLFVASLLHPQVRGPILELLLLESGIQPHFSVVNYLFLTMLCDLSVEQDQQTMEALLVYIAGPGLNETAVRDYLNPRVTGACLSTKREMRSLIENSEPNLDLTTMRLDHELCQVLLLPEEAYNRNQNSTVVLPNNLDDLLNHFSLDPDNLLIRLLEKHIRECSKYMMRDAAWPLGIVDLLLGRMSGGTKQHPALYDCMSLAINLGQQGLFRKLLAHTDFSREGFRAFQAEQAFSSAETLDAMLDHLNHPTISSEDYLSVVTPWFVHACQRGQLTPAIEICTKSRYRIYITPAIEFIRAYIDADINLPNIRRLLRYAVATQDDLEVLWTQAFRTQTVCHLDKVRMIMQAGYRGVKVQRVMAREIALGSDTALISTIVDNWQVSNATKAVPVFDYQERTARPASTPYINAAEDEYNFALSNALSLAIRSQRADFCTLLFERGAPLVSQEDSLVGQAVRCGPPVSLKEDTILNMFVLASRVWPDSQAVLDYILLQAVESGREQLMLDLLKESASSFAYGGECWYAALHATSGKLIRGLLSSDKARADLSTFFQGFLSGLAVRVQNLDDQCAALLKLHNAGFVNQGCFDWAFSVLCDHGLLTPHRAKLLFQCGASTDHRRLLRYTLVNGDLPSFHALVATCGDPEIIEEIFLEACQKILNDGPGYFFKSNDPSSAASVMEVLLRFRIKQERLNSALDQLVRKAVQERTLIPVLCAFLRLGARFGEFSGEALGRCYTLNDEVLMSLAIKSVPPLQARSAALKFLLCEAVAEQKDKSEICNTIPNLLQSQERTGLRIGISHDILLDIISFILNEGVAPAYVVRKFFSCIKVDSSLENCGSDCRNHIETLLSHAIDTMEGFDDKVFRCEQIAEVTNWMRVVGQEWHCRAPSVAARTCSLNDAALNRLFLQSASKGLLIIVLKLLELQVDVNTRDALGRSALLLATQENHTDVVEILVHGGARANDGSLHAAMCHQNHAAISALLEGGHDPQFTCDFYDDATPLGFFMKHEFDATASEKFRATLLDLLGFMYNSLGAEGVTRAITSTFQNALTNDQACHLMDALMAFFGLHDNVVEQLRNTEIIIGRLTYSALSLVRDWEECRLSDEDRERLAAQFEALDVKPMLYAAEGDQPPNATAIPEHLLQKHAFNTKDCAICGDKPENEHQIHAGLTPECAPIHGWNDDYICYECLQTYLQTKMFPHDDEKIKYKFPATGVFCWAPNCTNTKIEHHVLSELVDEGVFQIYDHALFQQELNSGSSVFKCATPDCPGAIWVDEDDKEGVKIFFCPVCFENTCMECNDLYEKHDNQPCPAGEQARTDVRKKAEEELSEAALKHEKKCPKCNLMYQKYYGCDHIVCGKNVYDNRVDSKSTSQILALYYFC